MSFRPGPRSQGMMQCLADPNLLKPYIILGPLKPFQFPMRSFAQKDRNDLLQQSYLRCDHFIDKPGTPVHPSQLAENVRGSSSSWERTVRGNDIVARGLLHCSSGSARC